MGQCALTTPNEGLLEQDTEQNESKETEIDEIKSIPNAKSNIQQISMSKSKSVKSRSLSIIKPVTIDSFSSVNNDNDDNKDNNDSNRNEIFSLFQDIGSQRDIYQLRLEGINICKPWYLSLNDNCLISQVETIINYHLGLDLNPNTIQYKGKHKINESYKVIIGNKNEINVSTKTFIIDSKTKFIVYWNKIYDAISNNIDNIELSQIINNTSNNTLSIGNIDIQFQRTLRIPSCDYKHDDIDNNTEYVLPPSLGTFPLRKLSEFKDIKINCKYDIDKDDIFILPMHQKEALWMLFNSKSDTKTAMKLCYNGINIINGKQFKSQYLTRKLQQNYIIISSDSSLLTQQWIDGINYGDDIIKQIVATPPIKIDYDDDDDDNDDIINIDDLCNCLEINVFRKLNDNVFVSYEDKIIKERDYYLNKNVNNLLYMTPEQVSLNKDDSIYINSTDIPTKYEITINDARNLSDSGEILFYHTKKSNNLKYKNVTNDYIKWIQKGAMLNDNNYVIVNCNDDEEFRVISLQNGLQTQISPVQWRITHLTTDKNIKVKSYQTLKEQNINLTSVLRGKCDKMEIFIKYNNNNNCSSFLLSLIVTKQTSIKTIKSMIEDHKNISSSVQELIYNNQILLDHDKNVKYYSIINGSTIHLEINKNLRKNAMNAMSPYKYTKQNDFFFKRQQEIGIIKNGKIKQIIYPDIDIKIDNDFKEEEDENDSISSYQQEFKKQKDDIKEEEDEEEESIKYDIDTYSKVIIYICNAKIWKKITKQNELPPTTINQQTYKMYNYPYLKTYDDDRSLN